MRPSFYVKQQGSMLIISIFVMLVMTLLGLAMTKILSTASSSVVFEVYGLKALNAARAGLERNVSRVFDLDATTVTGTCGDLDYNFGAIDGLENCGFESACESFSDINGQDYFRFRSTGSCTIDNIVVSRTVAVDARNQ